MHHPESGSPQPLQPYLRHLVAAAVQEHFPEDAFWFDGVLQVMPTDADVVPVGVVIIMINGTEEVDGLYLVDVIVASLITPELVDKTVEDLAIKSKERRGEIRNSLAQGTGRSRGLPIVADEV